MNASLRRSLRRFLQQALQASIGEGATHVWMVGQHNRHGCSPPQGCAQFANVAIHLGAIGSQHRDIYTVVRVQPEILVLQVDEMLRVGKGFRVNLRDAPHNVGIKAIRMLRNGTDYLHQGFALLRLWQGMLRYQQRLIHVAPLYHVVPTLAEIVFNIGDSQPFQDGMRVMPGMWDEIMHTPAQFIGEVMFWHIPAVKVAVQLN